MSDPIAGAQAVELLLRDIEEAHRALIDTCGQVSDEAFLWEPPQGGSIKATLEKAADGVSFLYGTLIARARGLPPLACLPNANYLSIREATMALQIVYRRFSNLLHDLRPEDLALTAQDESGSSVSLQRALEMTADHYRSHTAEVQRLQDACREAKK